MVVLFFSDNLTQRMGSGGVNGFECCDLFVKVAKHYALDSDGRGGDRPASKKTRHRPKGKPAEGAKGVTSASAQAASSQLGFKPRTMAALVVEEVVEFVHHVGRAPASEQS